MTHLERFYATVERRESDYPASWLGLPLPETMPSLLGFFQVRNKMELKAKLNDDIYPVEMPYHSPTSNAIYAAFDFAAKHKNDSNERTLTGQGFFANYTDPENINDFDWPEPSKYINPSECLDIASCAPKDMAVLGVLWSAHFQDACAAFGMEEALMQMLTEPSMFRAVIDRITDFYLEANEIFYCATKGKVHGILIGNDLGSQNGLILSPQLIREFVLPGTRKLIAQAKRYGLKVIHHSCGAISEIIPDLIEAGADVIHPIQALAKGMDIHRLKKDFGNQVAFCGGVDVQQLLVSGTPAQVKSKVHELKQLFPSGLIISPSHEAVLPDVKPENIQALFEAVKIRLLVT
jgi:uroporphyrinogen decarboxylase